MKILTTVILLLSIVSLFVMLGCKDKCEEQTNCELLPEAGVCQAAFVRYYYDQTEKKCKEFTWGGCGIFPFETLMDCKVCECNQ